MHRLPTCGAGKGFIIMNYKAFSSGKVSDRTNVSGFDRPSSAPFMLRPQEYGSNMPALQSAMRKFHM